MNLYLNNLVLEREILAKGLLKKVITEKETCEKFILITNKFHELALQAFANNKRKQLNILIKDFIKIVDLCQRLIDERNIT